MDIHSSWRDIDSEKHQLQRRDQTSRLERLEVKFTSSRDHHRRRFPASESCKLNPSPARALQGQPIRHCLPDTTPLHHRQHARQPCRRPERPCRRSTHVRGRDQELRRASETRRAGQHQASCRSLRSRRHLRQRSRMTPRSTPAVPKFQPADLRDGNDSTPQPPSSLPWSP